LEPRAIFDTTSSPRPQLVVTKSPAPTVITHGKNTTPSANTIVTIATDTLFKPPPSNFAATSQTEPQLVATTSPSPTLIDCEKIPIPSTITSTAITIDTLSTLTPAYPTSKTSKSVGFSPKTPKSGLLQPVPIAPIHPGHSDTPPFDISNPNIPFTSTNTKTLTWSDEPCNFDPGKPPSHPPPHAAPFGPRDLSVLCSGTDPWKALQHRKGREQRQHPRNSHFRQQKPRYYQDSPIPNFRSSNFIPTPYPPTFSSSIQWDQDPRLADLSRALKALGWVRR